MISRKPLLLYHANCPDGFGAKYAFFRKYGSDIEYVALEHRVEPFKGLSEDYLRDRVVWMADTSFSREDAIRAHEICSEFKIIDHHLSAKDSLGDLSFAHFNMGHSGAVLAWKECFPGSEVSLLLRYIEDRDLYIFKMPESRKILAAIDSYDMTIDNWIILEEKMATPGGFKSLVREGTDILRYNDILISKIKQGAYRTSIKGYDVPIINTPFFRTEIVTELSIGELFSAGYHYDGEQFIFSLRSDERGENSLDVSKIASMFPGGGGHKHASGFQIKSLAELK